MTAAEDQAIPSALAGVEPAHAVAAVTEGALAAVVSRVPLQEFDEDRLREHLGDMAWVERVARRHEEVLEAVGRLRTLVPMRMCSIYRDQAGVRAMLRREASAMRQALSDLRGRSEWGVKVFFVSPPTERGEAPSAGEGSGAAYMEQRRREQRAQGEADEHVQAACDSIHARLAALAAAALVVAPQRPEVSGHHGEMVLNGVYLVPDGQLENFHDAVSALLAEFSALGLELETTGPWPAYNFVPDAIGAAS